MKKNFLQELNWEYIDGYNGGYGVSTEGHIISFKRNEPYLMKPYKNGQGYLQVRLYNNGKSTQVLVHRLVAATFIENSCGESNQVNHINGVKDDNNVENLEWVTQSENMKHAYEIGLATRKRSGRRRRELSNEPNYMRYGGANVYQLTKENEELLLVGINDVEAYFDKGYSSIKPAIEQSETVNGYFIEIIGTVKEIYKEERIANGFYQEVAA